LPREWSKFPSQRSEVIELKAGQTYYIEALAEQNVRGENLAVAWQGPGLSQSIIASPYLTPWRTNGEATNGILREYWTNYSAGDLEGLTGPRAFESTLTVENVHVASADPGALPAPITISLNQQLSPEDNFRWVQIEGKVKFASEDNDVALLELTDDQAVAQVHASGVGTDGARRLRNMRVRVEGVCEGVMSQAGRLLPGVIWATSGKSIALLDPPPVATSRQSAAPSPPQSTNAVNPAMPGFYATRGVVTFNDHVLGNDYIFVQANAAAVLVALENPSLKHQLKVGCAVDLGGALAPGRFLPVLTPLVVKQLGDHPMPLPIIQPLGSPAIHEGRWSELEGVVHTVNSNRTLLLVGEEGPAHVWIGNMESNQLAHCVDARLRVRGVLLPGLLASPALLVPSTRFVDVVEPPPSDPFTIPLRSVAEVLAAKLASAPHRVRLAGEVTFRGAQGFFLQDASGGIRVRTPGPLAVQVGQAVEVLAFPAMNDPVRN